MRTASAAVAVTVVTFALSIAVALAQETKPVPSDSMRVSIPGCTKGYVFTAGRRTADQPGSTEIPEGLHLRMNGPKKVMVEIKAHEGAMIEITGIMKKDQLTPGVGIGGGVRIVGGSGPTDSRMSATPVGGQIAIDVEGWRTATGACPPR